MALRSVHIRNHEQRQQPAPHVVYKIEIQTSVRSWNMWRRYSEFVDLNTELYKSTGLHPPQELPPKHSLSIRRKFDESTIIQERLVGLEEYLRAVVASKDPRWRDSFAFRDFLGVPINKQVGSSGVRHSDTNEQSSQFTSSSWLDEYSDLQSIVRDIRADINKRDSLADRGEISASGNASVQAKKKTTSLLARIDALANGLETLGLSGLSEGELHRRSEMLVRLQDDCEKLGKMLVAARSYGSNSRTTDPQFQARADLLSNQPLSLSSRPVTRVFGGGPAPRETELTRPLDDQGLIQLRQQQMDQQDSHVSQLTAILQRQKHLGVAIGNELEEQILMLDNLNEDVDKFGMKLGSAKKQMNRLG